MSGGLEQKTLTAADWSIIGIYFAICLGLGVYSKFGKNKNNTAEEYFLAGRSMMWWAVGGSLYASNMGSEHFIGLAGSGAASGIGVVAYEWHASWILLLLGFFFVPIYIRSKIYTMPEYLRNRFQSKWMRIYLTVVSLISYITTKISVDLFAGALFLREAIGLNIYISSAALLVFTALYTLLGGLSAVIYTDVMQCTLMVIGALSLSILGFKEVGGLEGLWEKYPKAIGSPLNTTMLMNATDNATLGCYGSVETYWGNMFRPYDDGEFPWPGIIFSLPITGIWYWCTDQVIVQRTLGAKNMVQARLGTIVAGFLKLLPLFIMVMPGMISRVLYADRVACGSPEACFDFCENKYGCSNQAYPLLVLNILPSGLVGLMLAVMVAALMSSLSSAFNSSSTIFTMDIWRVLRPKANDKEMLMVGRVVVVVMVGIGIAWMPNVSQGHSGQLFTYLQTIQSYLAPPTCAVFLVGMLWTGLTEVGALSSMLFGLVFGIVRISLDVAYPKPHCGQVDDRPSFVKLHFMYYALIMFAACIIIMCVLSLFTRPVPLDLLGALTWKTINKPRFKEGMKSAEHTVSADLKLDDVRISTSNSQVGLNADQAELDEIEEFENQTAFAKWGVRVAAGCLVFALLFLWIWYR
ncbi:sodium/mannose cotransporter SLC5A10-like [Clytia hemisphaerica]|uniref:Uncharacterized protein n=1 Tax=Clytia hemisphaerica TaxID=252671 RepID=A0A7M5X7E2_9CNID|eukprot:TCONS_00005329-protein